MKFATILAAVAATAATVTTVSADYIVMRRDWSYRLQQRNKVGVNDWGTEYSSCNGKSQSPIDIVANSSTKVLSPLSFTGAISEFTISQQFDAFTATPKKTTAGVSINSKPYMLTDIKLRTPSEHTINNVRFAGELQFFHKAKDSSYAIVSLLLKTNDAASTPEFLRNFRKAIRYVDNHDVDESTTDTLGSVSALLAPSFTSGRVFNYQGSLSLPDCAENVNWWVLEAPLDIKTFDMKRFRARSKKLHTATDEGENARPVQPLNGRKINVY